MTTSSRDEESLSLQVEDTSSLTTHCVSLRIDGGKKETLVNRLKTKTEADSFASVGYLTSLRLLAVLYRQRQATRQCALSASYLSMNARVEARLRGKERDR